MRPIDLDGEILKLQKESLRRVAERNSWSYREFIQLRIQWLNQQHAQQALVLSGDANGTSDERYGKPSFPLSNEMDYWAYKEADARLIRDHAAELVSRTARMIRRGILRRSLPFLRESLAPHVRIPTDRKDISGLVKAIPIVHLADFEFYAAAASQTSEVPVPHIRQWFAAEGLVQQISQWLVSYFVEEYEEEPYLRIDLPSELLSSIEEDEDVFSPLAALLGTVLTGGPMLIVGFEKPTTANKSGLAGVISMGAKLGLWLHEYGHLFLGHLNSKRRDGWREETEADAFAVRCLAHADECYVREFLVGIILLQAVLLILWEIEEQPPEGSYPQPRERFANVAELVNSYCDRIPDLGMLTTLCLPLLVYERISSGASLGEACSAVRELYCDSGD